LASHGRTIVSIVPSRGEAEETASGSFKQKPKDDAIPQNLQAKKSRSMTAKVEDIGTATPNLLGDIRKVIEAAREQTAQAVNSTLVIMHWQIGKRIREDEACCLEPALRLFTLKPASHTMPNAH